MATEEDTNRQGNLGVGFVILIIKLSHLEVHLEINNISSATETNPLTLINIELIVLIEGERENKGSQNLL